MWTIERQHFKDTLAIPKLVKKSPGFTKFGSQNLKIGFPVVHDVIRNHYVIDFNFEKKD